jgi:hypothetical protein
LRTKDEKLALLKAERVNRDVERRFAAARSEARRASNPTPFETLAEAKRIIATLMSDELKITLCDHAAGNYRALTTMAANLLTVVADATSPGSTRSSTSRFSPPTPASLVA